MMTAKDGNRMFSSSEFLTVQQITSLFFAFGCQAKLCLARHLDIQAAAHDEDVEAEVNEAAFQELSDYVVATILLTLPICSNSFNLCQLMSKSRLST